MMTIGFFFRCNFPDAPDFKQEISIIAILRPDVEYQQVSIYYTHEFISDSIRAEDLFITDAAVRLSGAGQEIEFSYYFDQNYLKSMYIDSKEKIIVRPGEYYEIRIETDNEILTGHTVVPHSLKIITPQVKDSLLNNNCFNLLWNSDKSAHGYIINLLSPPIRIQFSENSYYNYRSTNCFYTTDTSYVISADYINFPNEPPYGEYLEEDLRCTVKIMALDENFKNHLFDGYDICGIEGGYGLFGSATIDSVDFYVIE